MVLEDIESSDLQKKEWYKEMVHSCWQNIEQKSHGDKNRCDEERKNYCVIL